MHPRHVLAVTALSTLAIPLTAAASTVTIGGTDYFNGYPFCLCNGGQNLSYQQLYSSVAFSGVEQIDAITFFPSSYNPAPISGTFTLTLSTTQVGVNQLSTDPALNTGEDSAVFFSGSILNGFTFTGTPYTYDPSLGNLLLTVAGQGTTNSAEVAGGSPLTSREWMTQIEDFEPYGGVDADYGLETQFTTTQATTVTPEPSGFALLGTGLLGFMGVVKRRARMR